MRPSAGGSPLTSAKPPSRKSSIGERSTPISNVPTTFFLRTEAELEKTLGHSPESRPTSRQRESTFGVESLEDALGSAFGKEGNISDNNRSKTPEPKPNSPHVGPRRPPDASDKVVDDWGIRIKQSSRHQLPRHDRDNSSPSAPPHSTAASSPAPSSKMLSPPKSVSLQSLKLSDEESVLDDVTSQAITSSGEDEYEDDTTAGSASFPELVMPSIQMPSRRPFTNKGKAMGKLKVLVAGETGIGKTSLIRSIVQICEDIVHVEPVVPSQISPRSSLNRKSSARYARENRLCTTRITEIHASTRAYPSWWTDTEESRFLRRRKSSLDPSAILDRNICFVDTPGFGRLPTVAEDMNSVVDYVESLLHRNISVGSLPDADLLGVVSGNGGVQVDLVIYLLSPAEDISKDIAFLQRLSLLTNVLPIIAKSEGLSQAELLSIKASILTRLQTAGIKPFLFGTQVDDALLAVQGLAANVTAEPLTPKAEPKELLEASHSSPRTATHPYAVSSTHGPDTETMDASLLMSSEYIQPLVASELNHLVEKVFDPDSIAWLRHAAAKKFLAWKKRTQVTGDSFTLHGFQPTPSPNRHSRRSSLGLHSASFNASGTPSVLSSASPSGVLVPHPHSPFYSATTSHVHSNLHSPFLSSSPSLSHFSPEGLDGPTDFSLAPYYSQMRHDEHCAEVRLAKWAADLQRSLRNERERFEELQRMERAKWLLERVGEEVRDGNIVTSPPSSNHGSKGVDWAVVRRGNGSDTGCGGPGQRYASGARFDSRDPLGLCDLGDEFRRRTFVLVKVLGGVSVVGAVVVAVARACGVEPGLPDGGLWAWLTGGSE